MGLLLSKASSGSPLYLLAACERLLNSGATYDQVSPLIASLAETVPELLVQALAHAGEEHGANLVRNALAAVALSRSGGRVGGAHSRAPTT